MSLKIWLPLNGSTINQGVAGFQPAAAGITYATAGKIGAKCCSGGSLTMSANQTASILNNQAITIAFWIKPLTNDGAQIFGNGADMGANNNRKFALWQYPTGQDFHWSWMNDEAGQAGVFASGMVYNALPINTWTHVCITYNNPNVTVYINGSEKIKENVAITDGISHSSTFAYETTILHSNPNRYINDFRIYDHCLSPREVKLLAQGLVAHYKLDNENPYDCSGYGNHGAYSSKLTLGSDSPRYGHCIQFKDNKYITTPARSYAGMKNSYTFSYWAKIPQIHGKMVFGFANGNRLNVFPWNTDSNPDASPDKSWFNWNTNDSANTPFRNNGVNVLIKPYNNAWHHYVITGDGSETKLYIDGAYVGTASSYKAIDDLNTQIIFSGYDTSANYKWNNGQISDFRIYATALSAPAVKELYQSSISFLDNGTLQCSEIVEKDTNIKYNKNGIVQTIKVEETDTNLKLYNNKIQTFQIYEL